MVSGMWLNRGWVGTAVCWEDLGRDLVRHLLPFDRWNGLWGVCVRAAICWVHANKRDLIKTGESWRCLNFCVVRVDEFVGYVQSANVMQFLCNSQYVIWGTFSFDCAMSRASNLGRCLVSRIVVEFTPSMHAVCAGIIPDELSPWYVGAFVWSSFYLLWCDWGLSVCWDVQSVTTRQLLLSILWSLRSCISV